MCLFACVIAVLCYWLSVSSKPDMHLSEVERATGKADYLLKCWISSSTRDICCYGSNRLKIHTHFKTEVKSDACLPLVSEATLRWASLTVVPSLWEVPGGPSIDLMLLGVSTNYMSLSWVDLRWTLRLGLPFLIASGNSASRLKVSNLALQPKKWSSSMVGFILSMHPQTVRNLCPSIHRGFVLLLTHFYNNTIHHSSGKHEDTYINCIIAAASASL